MTFQVVSFPQVSPPKPYIHLSPISATSPANLILLYLFTRKLFGEGDWSKVLKGFDVLLTVHLSIILVTDQLNTQNLVL